MRHVTTLPAFRLESGAALREVPVAYHAWGRLSPSGDNVVVVCHPLTADADAARWWAPLIGPGRLFDTRRHLVVCLNVPGSPYGTVSPLTTNPDTGRLYGPHFPAFTVRDTVALHRAVLDALGVRRVRLAVGGSMGGMHVLEWAFQGDFVRAIAPIAVGGRHSAWGVAWTEAQRQALFADPRWDDGRYAPAAPPSAGLAAARQVAMLGYRTPGSFADRFGRTRDADRFAVERYLHHQGETFVRRFDANCYVALTRQLNTHDVARGRGAFSDVLGRVRQPALVVGIASDRLYPLDEQRELAAHLPNARLAVLPSPHGHDAFLLDFDLLEGVLRPWLARHLPHPLPPPRRRPGPPLMYPALARPAAYAPSSSFDLYVAGLGAVGRALLDQLRTLPPDGPCPRLVGSCTTQEAVWHLPATAERTRWDGILRRLETHPIHPLVFVDTTGCPDVARRYPRLLAAGIHVVTPSKRANTFEQAYFDTLARVARASGAQYRYETTVGAGLPVVQTIRDLRATGDRIRSVRGCASGTLTFLFSALGRGESFSRAVRAAAEAGYTEPDVRDDLSGEDVARKFLILARTAGYALERGEITVESLVPEGLAALPPTAVPDALAACDARWRDRVRAAHATGKVLRYVGTLAAGRVTVGVEAIPVASPLGQLDGTDNLFEISTDRYPTSPIVVRGPGAGPEVTAAGVLADVLKAVA